MKITKKTERVLDVLKFLLTSGVVIWFLLRGAERLGYHWQWYRVPRYLFTVKAGNFVAGPLLDGLIVTFKISSAGLILALFFGLVTALFRLSHSFTARAFARVYLETIRNTPLLIQLFFMYFVLSPVLKMSAFTSAVLALSLFEGAYASEIFRAGVMSIDKGQWEAAYSLGIHTYHTYRYIILPQAFRQILPPLASQAISLIKDSALVSTIAIYDLTMQGQAVVAETFLTFEIWFTVAAIYLVITVSLSTLVHAMELKLHSPS
ncbi:polar amino acid ABC transporter permease [candidate division KSB3 bacterium]|uniref:Polar amino acid ABC transporter permease n=1 Tax=candidate division KSB3 bacterium TaxID=2044937 RepID=A0A2G6E909_9BACT|nr:MAG: polar amino acid ABC transporter permease [candidate division KSB3 bacterium]PIE30555.1 MAG: polar amino acid ABC transporter permease [candidate division KSB3 bacterium]